MSEHDTDPVHARDMSDLEQIAAEEPLTGNEPAAPPDEPGPYYYDPGLAAQYSKFVAAHVGPWAKRWQTIEPLNDDELQALCDAWGGWMAWKFGDKGPMHPLWAALGATVLVLGPRVANMIDQTENGARPRQAASGASSGDPTLDGLDGFDVSHQKPN